MANFICSIRLPIIVATGVTWNVFAKRAEKAKARRFWDFKDGTVTIIELPTPAHEATHSRFSHQFQNAFNDAASQDDIESWGAKSSFCKVLVITPRY